MDKLIYLVPAMALLGLLYMFVKFSWVSKQEAGTDRMKEISAYIAQGAMAFLRAEWKILAYFAVIVALLLGFMGSRSESSHWSIAIAFIIGAFFSALAGFIGMKAATKANVRTTHAARSSFSKALSVSFSGGSVMGLGVAGLAVLGLGGVFIVLMKVFAPGAISTSHEVARAIEILTGFSLGAESIALFARVGGGIYTKAADVGADLVDEERNRWLVREHKIAIDLPEGWRPVINPYPSHPAEEEPLLFATGPAHGAWPRNFL